LEDGRIGIGDTETTHKTPESAEEQVRFPKRIRHRGQVLATIYAKTKAFPAYRLAWRVTGQRRMERFQSYSEVKRRADALVKELAQGSHVTALTPKQATDALAALERLQGYFQQTGRRVSLLAAVSEFSEASAKLQGRNLGEVVDGWLNTVATVKRKDVAEAVEEFILADAPRTKAGEGQRAQLSSEYTRIRALRLRRFAKAFPGHAVCDVSKEHLDAFIQAMADASPKARNHHRAGIKQFLQWCIRKDYMPANHRLNEADAMRPEHANNGATAFYSPKEFHALLETAQEPIRAMIAIGGLAGLRTAEILRLTWEDVFRVPGHIEITAGKSKTRSRRLVEVCPALTAWIEPCRALTGKLWQGKERFFHKECAEVCDRAEVPRKKNGLRHSFCSHHFALHANENLTAQQAGNSPSMVHQSYKGLATKAEGEKWFNVLPPKSAENVIALPAATA
jgi:integrase